MFFLISRGRWFFMGLVVGLGWSDVCSNRITVFIDNFKKSAYLSF